VKVKRPSCGWRRLSSKHFRSKDVTGDRVTGNYLLRYALQSAQAKKLLFYLQEKFCLKPRSFCLIVACARSGSTAIAGWLSRQPSIVYANQSRILPVASNYIQYAENFKNLTENRELLLQMGRDLVWRYYTHSAFLWSRVLIDKENFDATVFPDGRFEEFLDAIHELFPHMKILFLVRDPVATIWSMQKKEWWGYSLTQRPLFQLSLDECIKIWNDSAMLASKYRGNKKAYICEFENLVANPEKESENISQFLKIPYLKPFAPISTATVCFEETKQQYILDATKATRMEIFNRNDINW